MTFYFNQTKASEIGKHGLYFKATPNSPLKAIKRAYFNGKLVYQYNPYQPGSTLASFTNSSKTLTLQRGVYDLCLTGGGGNKAEWLAGKYSWSCGGGSGATWEGVFYLPQTSSVTITAGGNCAASSLKINNTAVLTCNAGGNAGAGSAGAGGSVSVNGLDVVSVRKSVSGNSGAGTTLWGNAAGGASTSSYKWGGGATLQNGAVQTGGVLLKYVRLDK